MSKQSSESEGEKIIKEIFTQIEADVEFIQEKRSRKDNILINHNQLR